MKLQTINDVKITPAPVVKKDTRPILGYDMMPVLYSNTFICCKKNSGKSTLIYNILKRCCNKETKVIGFVSTHDKDNVYQRMKEMLDKKKIPNEWYASIHEDNALDTLLDEMKERVFSDDESSSDEEEQEPQVIRTMDEVVVRYKKRKPKKISQKYLLIFDDLSNEVKSPILTQLLKKNRHYRSKILISSQYLHDIQPQARTQLDNLILGKGLNDEKVKEAFKYGDVSIPLEQFQELYDDATHDKYNFFYVISPLNEYRKNFNQKYLVD